MKKQEKVQKLSTEVSSVIDQISMNINITNVEIDEEKNARYYLKYGDDEPGVRRPPFWRPYWCVTHLTNFFSR